MDVNAWYVIFICTTFVLPGLILLTDDGNFARKSKNR